MTNTIDITNMTDAQLDALLALAADGGGAAVTSGKADAVKAISANIGATCRKIDRFNGSSGSVIADDIAEDAYRMACEFGWSDAGIVADPKGFIGEVEAQWGL